MTQKYIAFLRGINVGGHHKVPMAELREALSELKLNAIETLLNSGNIIFEAESEDLGALENKIAQHLEGVFGFSIPTLLRTETAIRDLLAKDPFADIVITKDIRLYVSFLRETSQTENKLAMSSSDKSFQILGIYENSILSVLDLSKGNTVKGMENIEKLYGKDITTRNWKTIKRIEKKLDDN